MKTKLGQNPWQEAENRWLPDGFHFLGPEETRRRSDLLESLASVFESHGFSMVTLPAFDYSSTFLNQIPRDESSSILTMRDGEGKFLSPGVDLTLQVVKGMAARSHHKENQSVYYFGRKIRDHKKKNASRREIFQIGAESLGESRPPKVRSLLSLIQELIKKLSNDLSVTVVVSHAGLFRNLIELNPNWEVSSDFRKLLYSKNNPELTKIFKEKSNASFSETLNMLLSTFPISEFKSFKKSLIEVLSKEGKAKEFGSVLDEIDLFCSGFAKDFPTFQGIWEPSLLRDVSYYTGFVFQGYISGVSEPVFAGGVYDELYEHFAGFSKPACGFALQLDPLEEVLFSKKKR